MVATRGDAELYWQILRRAVALGADDRAVAEVGRRFARLTARALAGDSAAILTCQDDDTLAPLAGWRVPAAFREPNTLLERDTAQALRHALHEADAPWWATTVSSSDPRLPVRLVARHDLTSVAVARIAARQSPLGLLVCVWQRRASAPSAEDLALLEALAGQVALLMLRAQDYTDALEAGALRERHRVVRGLHDLANRAVLPAAWRAQLLARKATTLTTAQLVEQLTALAHDLTTAAELFRQLSESARARA